MSRTGPFNPDAEELKPSALSLEERTRLNALWNILLPLSPRERAEMKASERRMLAH